VTMSGFTEGSISQESSSADFAVPEAYAGKGWTAGIKSVDDLWKMTNNAQSLIGKRTVPSQDASDEEWSNFFRQIGAPETPNYELPPVEGVPENFDVEPYAKKANELFHKAGLTTKQANALWQAYVKSEIDSSSELMAQSDVQFQELTTKHFGDKFSQIQGVAQDAIKAFVPVELRESLKTASPEVLTAMIALASNAKGEIDRVKQEYGAEGKLPSGGVVESRNAESIAKEISQLKFSSAGRDYSNPEYKATWEKINGLQQQLSRLSKT
jgi:hypothetical protein